MIIFIPNKKKGYIYGIKSNKNHSIRGNNCVLKKPHRIYFNFNLVAH